MEKFGIACLLVVCTTILPAVAALNIECDFGLSGVSCRENNTTQKILIGVGVVLLAIAVVGILSCCCCGCGACCRSEPRNPAVVTAVTCSQQVPAYLPGQGYQPVPLQLSPAQLVMPTAPYPKQHPVAYPNYCPPPTYQEAASMGQPQRYPATQPFCTPVANTGDNPAFVDAHI
ncbi:protein shisa-5-like [Carcharodon carcharias]|uniref:protein shisa-5-like n=1 Tax=Carcharodon carcharias TaxID=13397 RepID=UPI001B7F00EB|nr:protein shisa-5-like [Carcharodon carcharias]